MILNIFEYEFIWRAMEAGVIVALLAPLIGIFLVLKRYSLIADTLSHVSLAGIAGGFLFNLPPMLMALAASVAGSLGIEKLRSSKKVYGESGLAILLSGSLAVALILLGLARGARINISNYLFGSILTVSAGEVLIIAGLAAVVALLVAGFFKELVYVTFDEDAAKASGIPVAPLNMLIMALAAVTVSLAIPIVGVLLISALIVIPVAAALLLRKNFLATILYAQLISVVSVASGIFLSFYFDLPSGGTIVLAMVCFFLAILFFKKRRA